MPIGQVSRKVCRNFADYGVRRGAVKSIQFLLRPWYYHASYWIYFVDVQRVALPAAEDDGFDYRFLRPQDEDAISKIETTAEWLQDQLVRRLQQGSLCMVALHANEVAAFNLVSFGTVPIPLARLRWTFPADQAWSEHIHTMRDWRQRGLATKIRHRMISELRKRGIQWFFGGTLRDHQGTLALAHSVGFVDLGILHYHRHFRHQRWSFEEFPLDEHDRLAPRPFHGIDQLPAHELSLQPT